MSSELNSEPIPVDPGLILLVPGEVHFVYERHDGEEFVAVLMQDPRLGQIMLALQPQAAAHTGMSLLTMVSELPRLRAQYDADNDGQP